jgi:hypothetical protein
MTMETVDREIAEKIMGWYLRDGWWVRPGEGKQKEVTTLPLRFVCQNDEEATLEQDPWKPSTNIEQAFMVVDKMRQKRFYCYIDNELGEWFVKFTDGYHTTKSALRETLTGAIAMAALGVMKA